ncbi:unnamed protein product [Adineta ricciae]|uniref:Cytochrome P450 n=1 Tax=Adineta ricciae TaxID=249248 RepID=A0A814TBM8_ADIRI|nr:unnamed protein product [Adineta ricciae]CAF1611811.1 unnamed protein product [Adineta ricciae]
MLTYLVVIGCISFVLYRLIKFWVLDPWSIHRYFWKQGIPGQYTPIVGSLLERRRAFLADDPLSHGRRLAEKYGDYYHSSFGPKAHLVISDPSLIEGVAKANAYSYHKSAVGQTILASLLGYGNILLAEGDDHKRHRRLVAPVFQHQNINSMFSLMAQITNRFLEKWTILSENRATDDPLTLDIHEELSGLTLDIVIGCIFGAETMEDKNVHGIIFQNMNIALKEMEKRIFNMIGLLPIVKDLPLAGKQRIDQARQEIQQVVQNIINQRLKGLTKSTCKGSDLLDLLLASKGDEKTQKFSQQEISNEAITFVLAGHETTSTLMAWTLYNLANHPDSYQQCQTEVDSILLNDELNISTISLLTYTEMVLKESLRTHQPVPVMLRTAVEDNTIVASDGKQIHIRKGTDIEINLNVLHRSEKYWHEPNKFNPSRFEERSADKLLAFNIGPRSCIGQNFAMLEAKIMLALIIKHFHFELVPGQKFTPDVAVTIRPKYGMWMRIWPRK